MISKRYGAKVPFYRPAKFARDDSTDFDALKHFVNWWENNNKNLIDMIVQIRPTTPFRDPKVIDEAIKILKKRKQFTGLRSVFEMSETAWKTLNLKKLFITFIENLFKDKGFENSTLPRQALPKTYAGQGYVDIVKPEVIKKVKHMVQKLTVLSLKMLER